MLIRLQMCIFLSRRCFPEYFLMSTQKQEVASKCESAHCELLATRNGTE